jgi:hypothetical protein
LPSPSHRSITSLTYLIDLAAASAAALAGKSSHPAHGYLTTVFEFIEFHYENFVSSRAFCTLPGLFAAVSVYYAVPRFLCWLLPRVDVAIPAHPCIVILFHSFTSAIFRPLPLFVLLTRVSLSSIFLNCVISASFWMEGIALCPK